MNLSAVQLPPPANWQDFETLCCDLWRCIWQDPNAQKNGRSGQPQHGVDVSGRPNEGPLWAAVQCKGKDNYSQKEVTESELLAEVEKAKKFTPQLSQWILATTGPKDARIEELARKLTDKHLREGLFSVSVWSWKDVVEVLDAYDEVVKKNYRFLRSTQATSPELDEIKETTHKILKKQTQEDESMSRLEDTVASIAERLPIASAETASAISEYQAELDYSRELLNSYKYGDAIEYLEKLKSRIWALAPDVIKFRILTNIGAAKVQVDQHEEAARLFLAAYQYNPRDEKAICNKALGHLLLKQFADATKAVRDVLDKNPSSANAYSIYIQIPEPDETLETALAKVPEAHRMQAEVAYVLGLIAERTNQLQEALFWLEKALESDKNNLPDIKGTLGGFLLKQAVDNDAIVTAHQVKGEVEQQIIRARDLLTQAWERVEETDLKSRRLGWLVNRSFANRLLDDLPSSIQDLDRALSVDGSNPELIKQRAILANLTGESTRALCILESLETTDKRFEAAIIAADILLSVEKPAQAAEKLRFIIEDPGTQEVFRQDAKRSLIEAYIKSGELDNARAISEEMRAADPSDILNLTDAAEIAKASAKSEDALAYLTEAMAYVSDSTSYRVLITLANGFYSLEQYEPAAEIYGRVANTQIDSSVTRRLVNSYYRLGRLRDALEICKKLRERRGPLPFITHMESAIYEEIDDFAKAKNVCCEYLQIFPDDAEMQLRLAVVNWRARDIEEVDQYLNANPGVDTLSLNHAIQLADLYSIRGKVRQCFDTIYEIRRKFFKYPEAHLEYVRLFFEKSKGDYEWLQPTSVDRDVAVQLQDIGGETEWYIIEKRPDADVQRRELDTGHVLATRLLGKKVTDSIVVREGLGSQETAQVLEIKSKFVYALHESMALYEKLFPEADGLWMIHVGTPDKPTEPPPGFQTILKQFKQRQQRGLEIRGYYKEGKLTIGSLARLLNIDPIRVCNGLSADADVGIRCARGNEEERNRALDLLSGVQDKIVIDLISLITIHRLSVADLVVTEFGKLLIAQTTVEALTNIVRDHRGFQQGGFIGLSTEGEQLVRTEMSAEEVNRAADYLQAIIDWIIVNCEVVPVSAALDLARDQKTAMRDMLGSTFLDSILIASTDNRILFSDDERLRTFARTEFAVEGVWTQAVLMFALNSGTVGRDTYNKATLELVRSHYYHTAVDADVLILAAKEANWAPAYPFTEVLKTLHANRTDEDAALRVATVFLYELWKASIVPTRRDLLVYSLLDALAAGRNPRRMADNFLKLIRSRFLLLPLEVQRFANLIQAWKKMHLL